MPDLSDMLINLDRSIDPIYMMVTGFAYLIGIAFAVRALYHLKVYGELRTMMSSNTSIKEPIAFLIVAAVFIYLPTGFGTLMQTSFGYSDVLSYSQLRSFNVGAVGMSAIRLIQLIGIFAFVRGWMLITKVVSRPGGGEGYGKGVTHIIGGVAGMNIVGTTNIISATFGL